MCTAATERASPRFSTARCRSPIWRCPLRRRPRSSSKERKAINTINATDYRVFEQINATVQSQPAAPYDAELAGQLAAIGIVKGQPFEPDAQIEGDPHRSRRGRTATARALATRGPDRWDYYPGSSRVNMLSKAATASRHRRRRWVGSTLSHERAVSWFRTARISAPAGPRL